MTHAPDPADRLDARADGQFGHRAGYTSDRLAWVMRWAEKGACLAAGEGLVLVERIRELERRLDERQG